MKDRIGATCSTSTSFGGATVIALRSGLMSAERDPMNIKQIAEAFSGHRFAETYDHLAADVRWVLPGQTTIEGRSAVVEACNPSAVEMAKLASAEFSRFVSVPTTGSRPSTRSDAM